MLGKTKGIVIKEIRYKDTSKILTIFTEKKGKVSILARGVYKPKSKLIGTSQIFSLNLYQLYRGRSFYYINDADVIEPYYSIRENLNRLMCASYLVELMDLGSVEENPNETLFNLLEKGLLVLSGLDKDYIKFLASYELKFISFLGYRPSLYSCANCKNDNFHKKFFSIDLGGVVCSDCVSQEKVYYNPKLFDLDEGLVDDIYALLMTKLDDLDQLNISNKNLSSIHNIMVKYILDKLDRDSFNSLDIYKKMNLKRGI